MSSISANLFVTWPRREMPKDICVRLMWDRQVPLCLVWYVRVSVCVCAFLVACCSLACPLSPHSLLSLSPLWLPCPLEARPHYNVDSGTCENKARDTQMKFCVPGLLNILLLLLLVLLLLRFVCFAVFEITEKPKPNEATWKLAPLAVENAQARYFPCNVTKWKSKQNENYDTIFMAATKDTTTKKQQQWQQKQWPNGSRENVAPYTHSHTHWHAHVVSMLIN